MNLNWITIYFPLFATFLKFALFSTKSEMNLAGIMHLRPHPFIYKWLSIVNCIIPVASHVSLSTMSGEKTQLIVKLFTSVSTIYKA